MIPEHGKIMMKLKIYLILISIALLGSFALIGCGTESVPDNTTSEAVPEDHASHNHGPGEHQDAVLATQTADVTDWCAEHAVPESECTKCNPELIAQFKASGDWCAGHDLPESHCRLCNPGLTFPQEEQLRTAAADLTDMEIGVSLNFRENASACATDGALIQFASITTADRAGITVQTVRESHREATAEAPAEILFDETEISAITISVDALVSRWQVSAGDEVIKGDVIAFLQSPEIAELKSKLVSARAHYKVEENELTRHAQLKERKLISDLEFERQAAATEEAKADYIAAENILRSAGLAEGDIDEIIKHGTLSNQVVLRAPENGVIIERIAQLGDLLAAGSTFAKIGNPGALWIEARLTEQQMRDVSIGDQLTFSSDGRAINRVGGEIIWLARFLDPHTRLGTVRAKVLDPNHQLRAGEFGRARIIAQDNSEVLLVPKSAVQWEGCCNVVFVKESVSLFRPRKVHLLDSNGPYYQVSTGVQAGDQVVVDGAFLMKTELKKSSIGAGCCGLEPIG
jgi:cobalt-zinc-cadmium efflux system membrane fusion protein